MLPKYVPVVRRVSLKASQVLSGFDVALVRTSGISGVVTDTSGHPIPGVCVLVDGPFENFTRTGPRR